MYQRASREIEKRGFKNYRFISEPVTMFSIAYFGRGKIKLPVEWQLVT